MLRSCRIHRVKLFQRQLSTPPKVEMSLTDFLRDQETRMTQAQQVMKSELAQAQQVMKSDLEKILIGQEARSKEPRYRDIGLMLSLSVAGATLAWNGLNWFDYTIKPLPKSVAESLAK